MGKSIIKQKRILTKGGGGSSISTPVSVANGGTGISSYAIGDILYASGTTTLSKLAIGTANQQLRVNAGATALEYFTPAAGGGITVGTTTITSGTSLRIPYNLAGVYQEQANFTIGAVTTGILDVPSGYAINGARLLINSGGTRNFQLGWLAANTTMSGRDNINIGSEAGFSLTSGWKNINIGYAGAYTLTSGNANIIIGGGGVGSFNTFTGNYNTIIACNNVFGGGTATNEWSNTISSSIALGAFAMCTANNQAVIGSANSLGYVDNVFFNGVNHTSAYSIVLNASGGSGTNNAGASITKAGGRGTGTAAGGNNVEQTSVKTSSGTTAQLLTDRHNIIGKYVDITGGSAQTFGNLALTTSGTVAGGTVLYTIEANDGTDFQALSGVLYYDVVNKAGTLTVVFSDDQQNTGACSSGTISATVEAVASGTNVLFQANVVSSLTETVLRVNFQVLNNYGVAIVTPA